MLRNGILAARINYYYGFHSLFLSMSFVRCSFVITWQNSIASYINMIFSHKFSNLGDRSGYQIVTSFSKLSHTEITFELIVHFAISLTYLPVPILISRLTMITCFVFLHRLSYIHWKNCTGSWIDSTVQPQHLHKWSGCTQIISRKGNGLWFQFHLFTNQTKRPILVPTIISLRTAGIWIPTNSKGSGWFEKEKNNDETNLASSTKSYNYYCRVEKSWEFWKVRKEG